MPAKPEASELWMLLTMSGVPRKDTTTRQTRHETAAEWAVCEPV